MSMRVDPGPAGAALQRVVNVEKWLQSTRGVRRGAVFVLLAALLGAHYAALLLAGSVRQASLAGGAEAAVVVLLGLTPWLQPLLRVLPERQGRVLDAMSKRGACWWMTSGAVPLFCVAWASDVLLFLLAGPTEPAVIGLFVTGAAALEAAVASGTCHTTLVHLCAAEQLELLARQLNKLSQSVEATHASPSYEPTARLMRHVYSTFEEPGGAHSVEDVAEKYVELRGRLKGLAGFTTKTLLASLAIALELALMLRAASDEAGLRCAPLRLAALTGHFVARALCCLAMVHSAARVHHTSREVLAAAAAEHELKDPTKAASALAAFVVNVPVAVHSGLTTLTPAHASAAAAMLLAATLLFLDVRLRQVEL